MLVHAQHVIDTSLDDWLFLFAGALETLVINMSKLAVSKLISVKERDPLASEVTTLRFISYYKKLLAIMWLFKGVYMYELERNLKKLS